MNEAAQHPEPLSYLQRADLARLAATIHRRRAQLLEAGGHDSVIDDLVTLAAQTGKSHRDAAGVFLNDLDGLIAEARRLDRQEREEHRQRTARHGPQISRLIREIGSAKQKIQQLNNKLPHLDRQYDDRVERLRQAGLTPAQMNAVLGDIPTPETVRAELTQQIAEQKMILEQGEREMAALSGSLSRGQDYRPAANA